ncbi:MAG: two-component regulator propeller domain-containing protein [Cellulophaga sp.]
MKTKTLFIGLVLMAIISCNKWSGQDVAKNTLQVPENPNATISNPEKPYELKYYTEQLDNTKGLSNSSVNTIFQDSENLIWIGTWDGLNRYDGNKFKVFRPELNNEKSLSNQVILKIDEDHLGQIWILTMHGINRYDKKTNVFYRYYFSRKNKPPLSENEFNMAIGPSKKVFCAVKDWGIGYYDKDVFQKLSGTENLPKESVIKMEFSIEGKLLVLFENRELHSLVLETTEKGEKFISETKKILQNVKEFEVLQNEKICLIPVTGNAKVYSLLNGKDITIQAIDVQNFIGHTSEGIIFSDKHGYSMINDSGNFIKPLWLEHLKNQKITTLIKGSENIVWVATDGDGLFKIYPQRKSFNVISSEQVPELEGGIVRAFLEVKGNSFWVATKGKGLFRFPSGFFLHPNGILDYENFNNANSTLDNAVYSLQKGNDSLIFIGTDGDGLSMFDLKTSRLISWSEIEGNDDYPYFKSTYAIYQDKEGFIWLGTSGYGLIRFKIHRKESGFVVNEFKQFLGSTGAAGELSSNIIYAITPQNQDKLWIGTRLGGLNLFDKKTEVFNVYKNSEDELQSLSNNDILCLYKDKSDHLWIGTSLGLNVLQNANSEDNLSFQNYTVNNGLSNNTIHGIIADAASNLWISTNYGLSKFDVDQSKFYTYTKDEGLQDNEFGDGASYYDPDSGFVFMGGIKGFNYFLPSQINEYSIIPNLFIDQISGQDTNEPFYQNLIVTPNSNSPPKIVLDHDQNFFDIELSTLTYINNEKCQYAYQLSDFNQDWNFIGTRKNISFTNVPAGEYSLWLKWSNSDGIWSNPVQAIDFQVKPIFWRSNLALFLYTVLSFLFMLFVLSYYKKRQSLKQNIIFQKREEEIHQNRLTFFTNIAHELQTPLTLIVGPVQKLSQDMDISGPNQRFVKMIQRNSSRLLFLTQQLLEFRKAEYDHLDVTVKQFDLVNLVEQIAELFDEWAIQKNIDYVVVIPSELKGWFDKDKIEKIVFNLLSNAFKYTPQNGKIKLRFSIEGEVKKTLKISTVNTGKGIPKHKLDTLFDRFSSLDIVKSSENDLFRTGIGLAYIKKLVGVMRGNIKVFSKENIRTTFTVFLPCTEEMFNVNEKDIEEQQVFISNYLHNVLEESNIDSDEAHSKISTLESILSERKTVLIVEDKKEIHTLLNELLKEKYAILSAYNGIEALEIIKTKIPDIIISDVMMPEMDGIELCTKIKGDNKTCHIPFIMLTAKTSVMHRIEGLESGANSYIPKPFHPDHLLVRIQKLIEEKELILRHFTQDTFNENLFHLPIQNEDKNLMVKVISIIRNNIDNENLQSSYLEKELGISSSQLYRKVKQISGFSLGDLIRTVRLKHAAELLRKSTLTVSQVCYQSGFNNRSYFYREFKKMYHTTPKNYQLQFS